MVSLITRTSKIVMRKRIVSLGEFNTSAGVRPRTWGEQEG